VLLGVLAAAAVQRWAPAAGLAWAVAPALFVGGLGGGLVISPNITMTLRCVPVRMAGSAGGALQTGQRFGAAIGTATLPGLFYVVLAATGQDFRVAVAAALVAAAVGVAAAWVIAVVELRRDRGRARGPDEGCCPERAFRNRQGVQARGPGVEMPS
jgi:hypothetical protein